MKRIEASAPGKLVLLGEYAVLEGAPALVLAVDRRAHAGLEVTDADYWEIVSPTLGCEARLDVRSDGVAWAGPAASELAWVATLLQQFPHAADLPACRVELDSDAFYIERAGAREKLGLGSSAALTVALLGALHALSGQPAPTLSTCIATHRGIQGGRGSGIDVAASLRGGLSRFRLDPDGTPRADACALPAGPGWRCVYSGRPASTGAMLAKVAAWRDHDPDGCARRIHELATIASRGVDAVAHDDAATFLSSLHEYANALARLGDASGAEIASPGHLALAALATACGAVYKSCGAGGGDVGITFAVDNQRLREFSARAEEAGFPVIALDADPEGLQTNVVD